MHGVLFAVVGWIVREVVIKFIVIAAIYAALVVVAPMVVEYAGSFVSASSLDSAWGALPAGLWYFLDWFRVGLGAPVVISAYLARFMIRRVPMIG
jgi:hypothetical protein